VFINELINYLVDSLFGCEKVLYLIQIEVLKRIPGPCIENEWGCEQVFALEIMTGSILEYF
jgi:hypothetical protein